MYELFYQLEKRPFALTPDPDYFYQSKSCQIALSLLELGLTDELALNVLLGDAGIGKTSIIQNFVSRLPSGFVAGVVAMDEAQSTEALLGEALLTLGIVDYGGGKRDVRGQWRKFVNGRAGDSRKRLLIIDDAQNLSFETLNTLLAFLKHRTKEQKRLHVILVGQERLAETYKGSYLENFIHSAGLSYRVQALRHREIGAYVVYRLKAAGAERTELMDYLALDAIYRYSEGVPRIINFLCDTAFGYGYAERKTKIDKFLVDKAAFKLQRSLENDASTDVNIGGRTLRNSSLSGSVGTDTSAKREGDDPSMGMLDSSAGGEASKAITKTPKKTPFIEQGSTYQVRKDSDRLPLDVQYTAVKTGPRSYRNLAFVASAFIVCIVGVSYLLPEDHLSLPDVPSRVEMEPGAQMPIPQLATESLEENLQQSEALLGRASSAPKLSAIETTPDGESDFMAMEPMAMDGTDIAFQRNRHRREDNLSADIKAPTSRVVSDAAQRAAAEVTGQTTIEQNKMGVQGLLDLANKQIGTNKLTMPENNNAFATYKRLLEISPENNLALAGLQNIADTYLDLAQRQAAGKRYRASLDFIGKGLKVIPEDKRLLDLKKHLTARQQQQKAVHVLLTRAEKQLEDLKLTWPNGDNAFETYQKVIELDRQNRRARRGLDEITVQYRVMTDIAQENGDQDAALDFTQEALRVNPDHAGFKAKRGELVAAIKARNSTEKQVQGLLNLAGRQIQDRKVIKPKGDNAVESYKNVLKVDPDNQEADMGLRTLAQQYEMLIRRKISEGDREWAAIMLAEGFKTFPHHTEYFELEQLLQLHSRTSAEVKREIEKPNSRVDEGKPKAQRRLRPFATF